MLAEIWTEYSLNATMTWNINLYYGNQSYESKQ